ncbi:ROK family transcriptional regulator [Actinotalea sp.]|uniref:ROK family transcriptional regulator n=1 Tax=Actinotalea sp. TaxID=1872145 RepID=UPI002B73A294|nr:ROK family transcriptional regulator [Actinotalea sp.]HRA51967.1 ROK family transcriptional regulator [Actinotalea sp.]
MNERLGTPRAGRAARQVSLRQHNLGLALRHILDAPHPLSRADIALATGLTRATVSALVDRLIAAHLVAELEPVAAQRAGRPAVPLVPATGTVAAVGMEVNVDYLGVRAVDLAGRVLSEHVEPGDFRGSEPGPVLDRLAALAGPVVAVLSADGVAVVGTALALPGLVDSVTGPLRVAPNLGWRDVDVVGLLTAHPVLAAVPPRLANEANLAARAEAHVRRRTGPSSFVYVSGEVGIGGAIVLDGEIFTGRHGWSGEIGHIALGTAGSFDEGGTLEAFAGQDAILDHAGLPRSTTVAELVARADVGEELAVAALARAGAALGVVLAGVVNVVDVEHVVLGGIYADLADHLRAHVTEQLRRRVIAAPWSRVDVDVARAGKYPAMTGGALSVLELLVEDPAAWVGEEPGTTTA